MVKEKKIRFYEKSHTYWLGRKKLTSVTTFIKEFFPEFNAREVARKQAKFPANKAAKRGVRYWLKEWKNSAEQGTMVHKMLEEASSFSFWNEEPEGLQPKFLKKAQQGLKYVNKLRNRDKYSLLIPESLIYDEELGLAGQIDLMVIEEVGSSIVHLFDWKTNKKITSEGYNGRTALEPISELPDSHLSKYGLQLSFYAYMLERKGYVIGDLMVVHLHEDHGAIEYPVSYNKSLVERLLKWKNMLPASNAELPTK